MKIESEKNGGEGQTLSVRDKVHAVGIFILGIAGLALRRRRA